MQTDEVLGDFSSAVLFLSLYYFFILLGFIFCYVILLFSVNVASGEEQERRTVSHVWWIKTI